MMDQVTNSAVVRKNRNLASRKSDVTEFRVLFFIHVVVFAVEAFGFE